MTDKKYIIEFIKDTPAKALTWHSAPYTGSVDFVVPKGTRALLGERMNTASHYFSLIEGYYSETWIESVISRAREISPIPERFNGGLSLFISIKTLLSDHVRFLHLQQDGREDVTDLDSVLVMLRKEYAQAKQCALSEETESFKKYVQAGMCRPQMSDEDRKSLLSDD